MGDPQDRWDVHWDAYGTALLANPANGYRDRLVLKALGTPAEGAVLVDLGAGQGELALALAKRFDGLGVIGLEASSVGVERARAIAAARGIEARFEVADLLEDQGAPSTNATIGVCSEVLEHVDDPTSLLANSRAHLAQGARLIVTVPGGVRTAFDRHIGHRKHFDALRLRTVLEDAGYTHIEVFRAGFPFFNLYKLLIAAQGEGFVTRLEASPEAPSRLQVVGTKVFAGLFRLNLPQSPFGWQLVATAINP
jgi:SAM-dependent methyltransferase